MAALAVHDEAGGGGDVQRRGGQRTAPGGPPPHLHLANGSLPIRSEHDWLRGSGDVERERRAGGHDRRLDPEGWRESGWIVELPPGDLR